MWGGANQQQQHTAALPHHNNSTSNNNITSIDNNDARGGAALSSTPYHTAPSASYHYEYHHGRGQHILVRDDDHRELNRPRYSVHCVACHCVDAAICLGIALFFFFVGRYCLYVLDQGGGGR